MAQSEVGGMDIGGGTGGGVCSCLSRLKANGGGQLCSAHVAGTLGQSWGGGGQHLHRLTLNRWRWWGAGSIVMGVGIGGNVGALARG